MIKDPTNPITTNPLTGAQRESKEGKGAFHLIPSYPTIRLAKHYEAGAVKRGDRNWEKGFKLSSFVNSAHRHEAQMADGDESEDHEAAILWNWYGFVWTREMIRRGVLPRELDDVTEHWRKLRPQGPSGPDLPVLRSDPGVGR
jgi:hypothetical protein